MSTTKNEELKIYSARRTFLLEYGCGILLLILLMIAHFKGINVPKIINYAVAGVGLLSISFAEGSRYFGNRYMLLNDKLLVIHGIINIKKKNVYYHPLAFVPDMNVKQSAWQKLFNYGTISITVSGEKFEIRNVLNPDHILDILEKRIEKSLNKKEENVQDKKKHSIKNKL